jgi:hypothetical protein
VSFDKNRFKEAFRTWVAANPSASDEQAIEFCHYNIPPQHMMKQNWLVEQSLQWFQWIRKSRALSSNSDDSFHEEDGEKILN